MKRHNQHDEVGRLKTAEAGRMYGGTDRAVSG